MQNKHITRLSFLCMFFSVIAIIVLYRQFILTDIILREISKNNKHLVEIYEEQIWSSSPYVIKKQRIDHDQSGLYTRDVRYFAKKTQDFFTKEAFLKVQIFDQNGDMFFDSNDMTLDVMDKDTSSMYEYCSTKLDYGILGKYVIYNGLTQAYSGVTANALFPKVRITLPGHNARTISAIVNYIPIMDDLGDVESVVVVYYDATELRLTISSLERKVYAALIILFCLFFASIIHNTNYAQKVIEKQLQLNRFLEVAKKQAEEENRSKTEFLANISHELRTPLHTIIGFAEIMLSPHSVDITPEKQSGYIADILYSGKHLLAMINDILDYSKASADKLKVDTIDMDLSKLAKASLRFVEQSAENAGVKLIVDIPETLFVINADPKRLKQALLNLLSNAIKFTKEGGSVTLSIVKNIDKNKISIRVIDTGIGIAEQDIAKALSSFGQVDNSLSRKYEGTGLGLPLAKKLVELMNGTFEITSVVDVGTTVTLVFDASDNVV